MPLIIPKTLPAYDALYEENVFVMHRERALSQHIRPQKIQHSTLNIQHSKKMKANTWKTILQIAISILTAIATTLGVTSCME